MFIQYELWKDCKHGCGYCFNKYIHRQRDKLAAIEYAINSLKNKNIPPCTSIGLMGGEFFDGQLSSIAIKTKFYELIKVIRDATNTEPPGRFLITTALMSEDSSDWFEFCDFLQRNAMISRTLVCTSWDRLYRFTPESLAAWESTVLKTRQRYPDIRMHVEMIITEYLLQDILKDPACIYKFEDKWNCRVDFNIPYLPFNYELHGETKEELDKKMPGFLPRRSTFLTVLATCPDSFDLTGLCDHRFHSSELHYSMNDRDWVILPERDKMETTCTNLKACTNCCGYLDSDIKIQEDIRNFLKYCK